jgi:hypothetical protein
MRIFEVFGRRLVLVSAAVVMAILIGGLFAYEPVTRNVVASDSVCSYCHLAREYDPDARLSFSTPHPATPEQGKEVAQCAACHLPEGFVASTFMYTHIASATDLFGNFRDRASERAGDWIPSGVCGAKIGRGHGSDRGADRRVHAALCHRGRRPDHRTNGTLETLGGQNG